MSVGPYCWRKFLPLFLLCHCHCHGRRYRCRRRYSHVVGVIFFIVVLLGLYKIVIIVAPQNACCRFIFDSSLFFNRKHSISSIYIMCMDVCFYVWPSLCARRVCTRHLWEKVSALVYGCSLQKSISSSFLSSLFFNSTLYV